MDILDRLLAHDTWTTRQLLLACQSLPDGLLDKEFDIDQQSLRRTFVHVIDNMEVWTDLLCERPVQKRTGNSVPELIERLSLISRDFEHLKAHRVRLECDDSNVRSHRVAERCGMVKEGHIRENKKNPDGTLSGTLHYGLLRSEFAAVE